MQKRENRYVKKRGQKRRGTGPGGSVWRQETWAGARVGVNKKLSTTTLEGGKKRREVRGQIDEKTNLTQR